MKKIVFKDNFAFIYLNKKFYKKYNIINTLEIYNEFFKSSISEIGNYITIKIEKINNDYSLNILAKEFANYLISKEYEKNEL